MSTRKELQELAYPHRKELEQFLNQPENPRAVRAIPEHQFKERFMEKMKREPLIPIGCLATVGALIGIAVNIRNGDSRKAQLYMRARVVLQGVTILAVVFGMWRYKNDAEEFNKRLEIVKEKDAEFLRVEREAFEARLKAAEDAYEAERSVFDKLWNGKVKSTKPTVVQEAVASKRWYHYLYWSKS